MFSGGIDKLHWAVMGKDYFFLLFNIIRESI